jgi:DNA-binding response OmpR family regulator
MPRVLIVEDDDVIADGMARHLEAGGFDAVAVEQGELGLPPLRSVPTRACST